MRITSLAGLTLATSIVAFASSAKASTFTFDSTVTNAGASINNRAGSQEIVTSFDDGTDRFSWSSTFTANSNGNLADGGWLVVSDGKNPKGGEQKYTMFYMDGDAKRLTAYTYNGVNGSNSWKDTNSVFLDSWALDVSNSASERTFSFNIDMTAINSRTDLGSDWQGTTFAENIGVWFHGVNDFQAEYNANGSLKDFNFSSQGWFDTNKPVATTKQVPEPAAMAGLVAVGLLAAKKKSREQG